MPKEQQKRYSPEELKVFEAILTEKVAEAQRELNAILEALGKKKENSTDTSIKMLEWESLDPQANGNAVFAKGIHTKYLRFIDNHISPVAFSYRCSCAFDESSVFLEALPSNIPEHRDSNKFPSYWCLLQEKHKPNKPPIRQQEASLSGRLKYFP